MRGKACVSGVQEDEGGGGCCGLWNVLQGVRECVHKVCGVKDGVCNV